MHCRFVVIVVVVAVNVVVIVVGVVVAAVGVVVAAVGGVGLALVFARLHFPDCRKWRQAERRRLFPETSIAAPASPTPAGRLSILLSRTFTPVSPTLFLLLFSCLPP